jgi:CHAT domain-containing protein
VAVEAPTKAEPLLAQARQSLAHAGSLYQWRAALDQAATVFLRGDHQGASPQLTAVVEAAQRHNHRYLEGRATWLQGMMAVLQGRLDEAQARYEVTLGTFDRMGDSEQAGAAHNLLSGVAYLLGDSATEWRHRQAAFESMRVSRSAPFRYQMLVSAAVSLRRESPETALLLQEDVLQAAREWGSASALADGMAQRSATLLALGNLAEAERGIAEAREHLQRVADPARRSMLEVPILMVESDLWRAANPSQAASAAEKAIGIGQARSDHSRFPQLYLQLAKANIVWGRLDAADRALMQGLRALEDSRSRQGVGVLSAFDESWELLDAAAQLAIRRGDYERAFALAELARDGRSGSATTVSLTMAQAQERLAASEALLVVKQFDDELAIWLLGRDQSTVITRPVRRVDAERLISRQQEEARFEVSQPVSSAELYDTIVRPLASRLKDVARLVVVPDAAFQDASFAAMWDRSRNQFLVEQVVLSTAPNVAALAGRESNALPARDRRTLIVDSGTDQSSVQAVAATYREPMVIAGASATPTRFNSSAPTADIVHLSVPTFANTAFPLMARAVLSDEPGRPYSGSLLGRDIASRPLPATRLVVLDEIRTTTRYRTAGTFNLARAFLVAGVPAVLGTLPGADERATRELMVRFHRELASQASAAEALTRLQRNVLRSNGRRLGAWSALVMYGSDR